MRVRILLSLPRKAPIVWSELFLPSGFGARIRTSHPHCAQRSGDPFLFHRLRSPDTQAPFVGRCTGGAAQKGRGGDSRRVPRTGVQPVRILLSLPKKSLDRPIKAFFYPRRSRSLLGRADKARINPRECAGRGVPPRAGTRAFRKLRLRERSAPPQSRHFCGNAVRHRTAGRARFDGGTMFPRKPLLLGRRFWLGVSPGQSLPCVKGGARAVGGGIVLRAFACQRLCREQGAFSPRYVGVQGPFRASCRTVSIDAPGAFSLGPLQRPVLFSREKRMGGWEHFPLGKKRLRPPGAKSSVAARCAESHVRPVAASSRPRPRAESPFPGKRNRGRQSLRRLRRRAEIPPCAECSSAWSAF